MPINTIELRKTKRQRIIIYVISPFHHDFVAVPRGWWADGVGFPKRGSSSFGVPSSWGRCTLPRNKNRDVLTSLLSYPIKDPVRKF